MGWERRGSDMYYYRKRRIGDRVVSEYIGSGEFAEALAMLDQYDRVKKALEREYKRRERKAREGEERKLDEICSMVRALTAGALLGAGYHTHKGQWRKRRDEQRHD